MAVIELWRGNDRQRPVERAADVIEPDAGVGHGRPGILAPRLDDENFSAGLGELTGNDRARRATTNDDVVVCSLELSLTACLDFVGGHCQPYLQRGPLRHPSASGLSRLV